MGAKSKQKGNRYERRCVKLLSEFTSVAFRRIPSSGAFNKFGGTKVAEYAFSGDVICDNKDFLFSVEAKSQKKFSFNAVLKSPDSAVFTEWWKQCVEDAQTVSRLPLLMFKPDVSDDFVAITERGMEVLGIPPHTPHFSLKVYGCDVSCRSCAEGEDVCNCNDKLPTPKIFKWKTFISIVTPQNMFGG